MSRVRSTVSAGFVAGCAIIAFANGSSGASIGPSQAAMDLASAYCAKFDACASFELQVMTGDVATCRSRMTSLYEADIEANGSGWTPSAMETCAQAIPKTSCDDALGHDLPSVCRPAPGLLAVGTACAVNAQCASGACSLGPGGKCGTCAEGLGAVGASCYRQGDCASGTTCVGGTAWTGEPGLFPAPHAMVTPEKPGKCAAYGGSGAVCNGLHPCAPTLACKNGTCGPPDTGAMRCSFYTCNKLAGERCNDLVSGTCVKEAIASSGQPCGTIEGALTVCADRGACRIPTGAVAGTCIAAADDFAACDAQRGPGCAWGTSCIAGVCTRPVPALCH